jgi:transposase
MEESVQGVVSAAIRNESLEETMLREDGVREILARLERGEGIKRIARELGISKNTVRRWRRVGEWRRRVYERRPRKLDRFAAFVERRGAEVGWNGAVLFRELRQLGYDGGSLQVRRYVQPLRERNRLTDVATVRFETGPGEQAQIDFGQVRLWISEALERVHLFVFTLGFSRRLFARGYPDERLCSVLDGHERAFHHFGGLPLTCLYDNARTVVAGRSDGKVLWHRVFEDFARYYGFTPRACQPYRARTKGKVESGVKYVKRNALAGKRFASWEHLNEWLLEWATTVSDLRVHGTTHERPIDRFAREQLTPIGERPLYHYERVKVRKVPSDGLVSIAGARYSVPVRYVGETVTVHETTAHHEIFHATELIARHEKAARHAVVMRPEHYAGLLRPGRMGASLLAPPRWDPAFLGLGDVAVRDLRIYQALAEEGGVR